MRQYKQSALAAPAVWTAGGLTQAIAQAAAGAADGIASSDIWVAELENDANKKLKSDFEKFSKSIAECVGKPLDKQVALNYSQVLLYADAVKKTNSFDPSVVYKAIKAGTWALPQGEVKFQDDGQAIAHYYGIIGKNGSVEALQP
jgi:ABC-type branched-subunit amino acid transport system substrate-binding protein